MQRIAIIGTSGSGKTTLARRLAHDLGLPHLELDAIYHQPGWTPLPVEEFQAQVQAFCAADRWVTCGKYSAVWPILFERADTIVCLDHNRVRQTVRVAWRTVRRVVDRQELWNGNRETVRNLWPFGDPERTIIGWTWRGFPGSDACSTSSRPNHRIAVPEWSVSAAGARSSAFSTQLPEPADLAPLDHVVKCERYGSDPCRPD